MILDIQKDSMKRQKNIQIKSTDITKVVIEDHQELKNQLQSFGIKTNDINHIIISHFHADHIGGLQDFPNAKIC